MSDSVGTKAGQVMAWVIVLGTLSLVTAAIVVANVWAWSTIASWL
jgi:hypothetical protein